MVKFIQRPENLINVRQVFGVIYKMKKVLEKHKCHALQELTKQALLGAWMNSKHATGVLKVTTAKEKIEICKSACQGITVKKVHQELLNSLALLVLLILTTVKWTLMLVKIVQ